MAAKLMPIRGRAKLALLAIAPTMYWVAGMEGGWLLPAIAVARATLGSYSCVQLSADRPIASQFLNCRSS